MHPEVNMQNLYNVKGGKCRSRWPHGVKHEPSSPARTLGSWVLIPLKTWMSVCAFLLCLCCPVCR
jgi:hypothetical protein